MGASALGTLQITTRDGNTGNVDLSSAKTVQDVINLLDNSGLEISADYNSAGTGLQIRDLSGGTSSEFSISSGDDTADRLGIKTSTVDTVVQGEGLDRKFISRSTLLSDLNQGRGVALGSFRITDTTGAAASVNLSSASATTVGEVIDAINNAGLAVQAKINTKGDGIEIIDTAEAGGTLSVADLSNGTSAKDLRILGTGTRQTIDGSLKTAIDGSQVDRILVEATDSLDTIVSKIAAQAKLASASVVGSGSDFRLQIASARGGEIGRLAIDTTGLNLGFERIRSAGCDHPSGRQFDNSNLLSQSRWCVR